MCIALPGNAYSDEALPAGIEQVSFLGPHFLTLSLETGRLAEEGELTTYEPGARDRINRRGVVHRRGKPLGQRVGDHQELIFTFDRWAPGPLDDLVKPVSTRTKIDELSFFRITSQQDPNYASGESPVRIWRKSKPIDTARLDRWAFGFIGQHDLTLELPHPLQLETDYTLHLADEARIDVRFSPDHAVSEAVHVNHNGFAPRDGYKAAYMSAYLGSPVLEPTATQPDLFTTGMHFDLIDRETGQSVFRGKAELEVPQAAGLRWGLNYNGTDVFVLDFSSVTEPGRYRVCVEAVGCSITFDIAHDVWSTAFKTAMHGLYHQRSGIALGPPHTHWQRPRDLHPADGFRIRKSGARLIDTRMGLNLKKQDPFKSLIKEATDEIVQDAWGGWHDAGDFDRRAQHLEAAARLLLLAEFAPEFVATTALSIPESGDQVPDLIDEVLWTIEFYRRIQEPEGGIPGGVEADEHPQFGEGSWMVSQELFVYAPDPWSTYLYVTAALRAASLLQEASPQHAERLHKSALEAMAWAERHLDAEEAGHWQVRNARNLAALECYRQTGAERWHELFQRTSVFPKSPGKRWTDRQFDAAYVYAKLDRPTDRAIKQAGVDAIIRRAEWLMHDKRRGGFGQLVDPHVPYGYSYTSTIPADAAKVLVLAHALTGRDAFRDAIIADAQFGLGANPDNMSYTTGLGHRTPRAPLIVDMAILGAPPPPGITLFGHIDWRGRPKHFATDLVQPHMFPAYPDDWPIHEMYHGFTMAVPITEFSIHATIVPTAFVWGYLAASG